MQTAALCSLPVYPREIQIASGGRSCSHLLPARIYAGLAGEQSVAIPGSCILGPGSDSALGTGRRNGCGHSVDSLRT